jgi:hypothetical protein
MVVVLGTTTTTVMWDLNYAVVIFTLFYQAMRRLPDKYTVHIPDFGADEDEEQNGKVAAGKTASVDESVEISGLATKSIYDEIELVETSKALR